MERTTTETGTAPATATEAAPRPAVEPRARRVAAPKKLPKKRGVAVGDPVGDMLTRVRNAVGARHETVEIPASRLKSDIARILKTEGYIAGFDANATALTIKLKYSGKAPALTGVERVSRPGRRVYARRGDLPRVLGGLGIAIVSTSAGVMTGREARRKGLGGEVLAQVW
ncbi:MAG: 30S ribosomal protein S8 [Chloroflexota bacterium]|nr:30S ribosomal protein S8 [Chloroflexota bacterium]MDE3103138.1 30S ribosomal protein S8 [Chloroflexota bacterium]